METTEFIVIALIVFGVGLVSRRLTRTVISVPMILVAVGLFLGEGGIELITLELEGEVVELVFELTLVLVLFSDASRVKLSSLSREFQLPLRMLAIGLPLVVIAGTVVALGIFPELSFGAALVLAVVLAPTDAALGKAVLLDERVPERIRQTLNVESGLNDGLAAPLLTIALAIAAVEAEFAAPVGEWVLFIIEEIGIALVVGPIVGYLGGSAIAYASEHDWMSRSFQRIATAALAIIAASTASVLGGNLFVAAFVAGVVVGNVLPPICEALFDFTETEGELLTAIAFLVYGAAAAGPALSAAEPDTVLYAVLSLTVIRMVPIALSLIGTNLRPYSVLFLGWFGPRGLASIVFALTVLSSGEFLERGFVSEVAYLTVFISVFVHGLTAVPAAARYGSRMEEVMDEVEDPEAMAEMGPAPDVRMRYGHRSARSWYRPDPEDDGAD